MYNYCSLPEDTLKNGALELPSLKYLMCKNHYFVVFSDVQSKQEASASAISELQQH